MCPSAHRVRLKIPANDLPPGPCWAFFLAGLWSRTPSASTVSRLTRSESARQPGGGGSTVYSRRRSFRPTASSRRDDSQRFGSSRQPRAAVEGSTPDAALRRRTAAAGNSRVGRRRPEVRSHRASGARGTCDRHARRRTAAVVCGTCPCFRRFVLLFFVAVGRCVAVAGSLGFASPPSPRLASPHLASPHLTSSPQTDSPVFVLNRSTHATLRVGVVRKTKRSVRLPSTQGEPPGRSAACVGEGEVVCVEASCAVGDLRRFVPSPRSRTCRDRRPAQEG